MAIEEQVMHKHNFSEVRADSLDQCWAPHGGASGAAPGAPRTPGRGFRRRSKKSARSFEDC
eukprot:7813097-Pyramimonas_sp.AAC.1